MIRNLLLTCLAASFALVSLAYAQFERGPRYDSHDVSLLLDRVHSDLNHAYANWRFSENDRERLNHAEKELREFAKDWNKREFDKDQLDDAIESVQHVLDHNKLSFADRDTISADVSQLRRMREAYDRHEIGGIEHR